MVASIVDPGATLAEVWPEASRRLAAYLRARGLTAAAAEDIVQEVAVRALRSQVSFADVDDLMPWASTVAWRIHIGELRKAGRDEPADLPDRPATVNVEDEAIARVRAGQLMLAISRLSHRDRTALAAPIDSSSITRREAGRLAVARHRARARLKAAMGGLGSLGPWLGRRTKWFGAVAVSGTVIAALSVGPGGHDATGAPETAPVARGPSTLDRAGTAERAGWIGRLPADSGPGVQARAHLMSAPMRRLPPYLVVSVAPWSKPASTSVTVRPKTPHEHIYCTGSFILLPNRCVG